MLDHSIPKVNAKTSSSIGTPRITTPVSVDTFQESMNVGANNSIHRNDAKYKTVNSDPPIKAFFFRSGLHSNDDTAPRKWRLLRNRSDSAESRNAEEQRQLLATLNLES